MKKDDEKKGFFGSLFCGKKTSKKTCCGSFEFEEIIDENLKDQGEEADKKRPGCSCCK